MSSGELMDRYGLSSVPDREPETLPPPELFPKRWAWTVRTEGLGRMAQPMAWGFPTTVRGKSGKPLERAVTNVRNYTSPFWRSALLNPERRCLVPFTEFCEWEGEVPGKKVERWFSVPSQPITSFAGIWRPTPAGPVMAFLTCDPNPIVAPVHPTAMPVLLMEEDEERWLNASLDEAMTLVAPFPSQLMRIA